MSIPLKDSLLLPWSANFDTRISAEPTVYGLTVAQATEYATRHDTFESAYNTLMTSRANGTWSEALTAAKETAKKNLLALGRELYAFIAANTTLADETKIAVGVHVRKTTPSPVPAPGVRPGTDVVSVVGRKVSIRVHDAASLAKRGKPAGVVAAWVYSYVGAEYPSDPTAWDFQGSTSDGRMDITFAEDLPAATQVWICAAWVGTRQETGPVSVPVTTYLQYAGAGAAVAALKVAA